MVASFLHQTQYDYYGGNISVSIEDIALDLFSANKQSLPLSAPPSHTCHAVFHSFLYDDIKQHSTTTAAKIKLIIELLRNRSSGRIRMDVWSITDVPMHYLHFRFCLKPII